MTIVDRSSEKSDHESVGCNRSSFTSGDVGMDGSCSSSWAVGPTVPGDSPRLKAPVGCLGPTPGAAVYNNTPSSVDRPKEQGRSKDCLFLCVFKLERKIFICCTYSISCKIVPQAGYSNIQPNMHLCIFFFPSICTSTCQNWLFVFDFSDTNHKHKQ